MRLSFYIIFTFFSFRGFGQNLVPNPSFENYDSISCLWTFSQTGFNNVMQDWTLPTQGTSDIFNTFVNDSCYASTLSAHQYSFGQQQPKTGDFMCGLILYGEGSCSGPIVTDGYREYIEVRLNTPLITGNKYYAEMYVSIADNSQFAINNIGMYFSDNFINDQTICSPLNFIPQVNEDSILADSINWIKISRCFIANSPSEYLIIGNFYDDLNTTAIPYKSNDSEQTMYFIDDVLITPYYPSSYDTTICLGDTIKLGESSIPILAWTFETSPDDIISTHSTILVSPSQTTSYIAYTECDTSIYKVHVQNSTNSALTGNTINCNCKIKIPNAFTPNQDNLNDSFSPISSCELFDYEMSIYDRWGNKVFESKDSEMKWDGKIKGKSLSSEVFNYSLKYKINQGDEFLFKSGNVALIR